MTDLTDILEDELQDRYPEAFALLLKDHTTRENILWATNSYEADRQEGYRFSDRITAEKITGANGRLIQPRIRKSRAVQASRTDDNAEVFTPSWVCNAQNNLIDEAWFSRADVFNTEYVTSDGRHDWVPSRGPVRFPEGRTWQDYVRDRRLEITCGEAPYLVSRYDTTTGEQFHDLQRRVGLLDRKLRVVSENCHHSATWRSWARKALQATYGFELQGDNLLLAREALLYTVNDYYRAKFNADLSATEMKSMAYIISWNLWQMDGLRLVVPGTCHDTHIPVQAYQKSLFGTEQPTLSETRPCPGCKSGSWTAHNGIPCRIRTWSGARPGDWDPSCPRASWSDRKPWQVVEFRSLLDTEKKF